MTVIRVFLSISLLERDFLIITVIFIQEEDKIAHVCHTYAVIYSTVLLLVRYIPLMVNQAPSCLFLILETGERLVKIVINES